MDNETYVNKITEKACREELIQIRNRLDALDEDDCFGTEGWKHTFNMDE